MSAGNSMKIVFMGSASFAIPSLSILLENNYHIVGVVTAPDKPAGRGQQLSESPVKKRAVEERLKLLQPTNLKSDEFQEELKELSPDLQVVVAFRILPEVVWGLPEKGTINLHASLLPQYRGAAPINWVIMNGEKETGVTTFFIQQAVDTGKIILQKKAIIGPKETAGELHDKLMQLGAEAVLATVQAIDADTYKETEQPLQGTFIPAPKIFREDTQIDWTQPLDKVYDLIRGLSPYPAAWTTMNDKVVKVYDAMKDETHHGSTPGTIDTDRKTYLKIAVPDGFIVVKELQLEGKKRLTIQNFLAGLRQEVLQITS